MSLARKIDMPALWTEITEAVAIGGVKALQVAFYEFDQLPEIMRVIESNRAVPGSATEMMLQVRRTDAKGRQRRVIREGSASTALLHKFTLTCPDLMRGLSRPKMAELAGLSVHDNRLEGLCASISEAALRAWGMELAWDGKGRFKVLTAKQSAEKETRLGKQNVLGGLKRNEKKRRIAENKGLPSSAAALAPLMLFEGIVGESDALGGGHEG